MPLFDIEDLGGHLDLHILLHRYLAGESHALARLSLGNVGELGRENITAPLEDLHGALSTGPATAAGGGNEDLLISQDIE